MGNIDSRVRYVAVLVCVMGMLALTDLPPPVAEVVEMKLSAGAGVMAIPPQFPRRARAALRLLLDGNKRFVAGSPMYTRDISSARAAARDQNPFAAVFTCVDSRVTAESLFDCDFGQLIVVRTAAHVPDEAALGSLRFAVAELDVPLVIVLGHERCGAIRLAVDTLRGTEAPTDVGFLVNGLRDPVAKALSDDSADPYTTAMRLQVEQSVSTLAEDAELAGVSVVGARYDLDKGTVHII